MIDKATFLKLLRSSKTQLTPSQNKISLPILRRIYLKMRHGIKFSAIHISNEGIIVNGHHRYVGSVIAEYGLERANDYPTPSRLNDLQWEDVEFVEEDWDTQAKVKMLNEIDAKYNKMSVEDIEDIIK